MSNPQTRKTIAIVGASADRSKYGNRAVRAYLRQGYEVFPVNPRGGEIEGLQAYASVADIPGDEPLGCTSMYVPPEIGITLLDEIATRGCEVFFLNPGSEDDALLERARELDLEPVVACSIIAIGETP